MFRNFAEWRKNNKIAENFFIMMEREC
jgi:hypothetical protein